MNDNVSSAIFIAGLPGPITLTPICNLLFVADRGGLSLILTFDWSHNDPGMRLMLESQSSIVLHTSYLSLNHGRAARPW